MVGLTRSTDAGIVQRTTVWASRDMLKWAAPVIVLDRFGQSRPIPANKGVTAKFRRPRVFTAITVPLQEGVTPASTSFEYEDVSVTLRQYGQVVEMTDLIADTHEDPVLRDATKQCGENIGRSTEALTWGVLKAGTNVFYVNGTSRTAVNTPLSLSKQRAITRSLTAQKAMMISSALNGSPDYATMPIEAGWVAVGHSDFDNDIRELPGFVPTAKYGSRKPLHEREVGSVEQVRYILSPDLNSIIDAGGTYNGSGTSMVSTSGSSADVYPMLYIGQDAYGTVPLRGAGAVTPTIIPVDKVEKSDPLGQRGMVGWKMYFATVILNQLWMARLEAAVTAL